MLYISALQAKPTKHIWGKYCFFFNVTQVAPFGVQNGMYKIPPVPAIEHYYRMYVFPALLLCLNKKKSHQ